MTKKDSYSNIGRDLPDVKALYIFTKLMKVNFRAEDLAKDADDKGLPPNFNRLVREASHNKTEGLFCRGAIATLQNLHEAALIQALNEVELPTLLAHIERQIRIASRVDRPRWQATMQFLMANKGNVRIIPKRHPREAADFYLKAGGHYYAIGLQCRNRFILYKLNPTMNRTYFFVQEFLVASNQLNVMFSGRHLYCATGNAINAYVQGGAGVETSSNSTDKNYIDDLYVEKEDEKAKSFDVAKMKTASCHQNAVERLLAVANGEVDPLQQNENDRKAGILSPHTFRCHVQRNGAINIERCMQLVEPFVQQLEHFSISPSNIESAQGNTLMLTSPEGWQPRRCTPLDALILAGFQKPGVVLKALATLVDGFLAAVKGAVAPAPSIVEIQAFKQLCEDCLIEEASCDLETFIDQLNACISQIKNRIWPLVMAKHEGFNLQSAVSATDTTVSPSTSAPRDSTSPRGENLKPPQLQNLDDPALFARTSTICVIAMKKRGSFKNFDKVAGKPRGYLSVCQYLMMAGTNLLILNQDKTAAFFLSAASFTKLLPGFLYNGSQSDCLEVLEPHRLDLQSEESRRDFQRVAFTAPADVLRASGLINSVNELLVAMFPCWLECEGFDLADGGVYADYSTTAANRVAWRLAKVDKLPVDAATAVKKLMEAGFGFSVQWAIVKYREELLVRGVPVQCDTNHDASIASLTRLGGGSLEKGRQRRATVEIWEEGMHAIGVVPHPGLLYREDVEVWKVAVCEKWPAAEEYFEEALLADVTLEQLMNRWQSEFYAGRWRKEGEDADVVKKSNLDIWEESMRLIGAAPSRELRVTKDIGEWMELVCKKWPAARGIIDAALQEDVKPIKLMNRWRNKYYSGTWRKEGEEEAGPEEVMVNGKRQRKPNSKYEEPPQQRQRQ